MMLSDTSKLLFFCYLCCNIDDIFRCSLSIEVFFFTSLFSQHRILFLSPMTLLPLSSHHQISSGEPLLLVQQQTYSMVLRKVVFKTSKFVSDSGGIGLHETSDLPSFPQKSKSSNYQDQVKSKYVFFRKKELEGGILNLKSQIQVAQKRIMLLCLFFNLHFSYICYTSKITSSYRDIINVTLITT